MTDKSSASPATSWPVVSPTEEWVIRETRTGRVVTFSDVAVSLQTLLDLAVIALDSRKTSAPSEIAEYVAWCRYVQGPSATTIVLCDSDSPGAFKVYRSAVSAISPITSEQLAEVKDQCETGLQVEHECPAMFALAAIYADLFAGEPPTEAAPILPPADANGKRHRLFYWEDTEDCWCPADGYELTVANIIDAEQFLRDGEEIEIRFKRQDMTDAEHAAIPEG